MASKENIKTHTYDTGRFRKITWHYKVSQRLHSFVEELDFEPVNALLTLRRS